MQNTGISSSINRLQKKGIAALIAFVLTFHLGLIIFEVRSTSEDIRQMITRQILGFTSSRAQTGDLLSLQQNMDLISEPIANSFPIEIQVTRVSDHKILVAVKSPEFHSGSPFIEQSASDVSAMPFGLLSLTVAFDYSNPLGLALLEASATFLLLLAGLLFIQRHILSATQNNLVPIDDLTNWLSNLDPESLRRGLVELPDGIPRTEVLSESIQKIFLQIDFLAREVAQLESERKLGEIAAQVSHDIRSPLSALNIILNTFPDLAEEKQSLLRQSIQRINAIANDLLQKSKTSSAYVSGSVGNVLENIVREKRVLTADRPGVEIKLECRPTFILSLPTSLSHLERTVSNLMNNAVEAIELRGVVRVCLNSDETDFTIEIHDDGRGMSPEIVEKLGEKGFSYGKNAENSGSGLGVYQAKRFVEAHGGSFQVLSSPNLGTQIKLVLPKTLETENT